MRGYYGEMGSDANLKPLEDLSLDLARMDEAVLAEVVREAEQLVDAQFTAIFASDQRALTLGGIAGSFAAAAIGVLIAEKTPATAVDATLVAVVFVFMAIGLLGASTVAVAAALPSRFHFPGNEPENWRPKYWSLPPGRKPTLKMGRVEQAIVLQAKIASNRKLATRQAKLVRLAVYLAFGTVGIGALALLFAYILALLD